MPTVLRSGPFRLFFYSADRGEPAHVHVEQDDSISKFWLEPVRLEWSRGFSRADIAKIESLIEQNRDLRTEAWHEYFAN